MKKLLLLGAMLTWGAAASAQTGGAADQCPSALAPAIQQTNVSTVERNADNDSAVIQLDIVASVPDGAPSYAFSSSDERSPATGRAPPGGSPATGRSPPTSR